MRCKVSRPTESLKNAFLFKTYRAEEDSDSFTLLSLAFQLLLSERRESTATALFSKSSNPDILGLHSALR